MKRIIILLFAVILSGCASTSVTSFTDPDYTSAEFNRILVVVNSNDLENRLNIETNMVFALKDAGVYALESYKLFPPTRQFTPEEKISLLIKKDIKAFLSITIGKTGVQEVYIPPTSSTTKTEGDISFHGNSASYSEKSKTAYLGGYTLSKPWAKYATKLFDVSNGRMVWLSDSFTGGSALANFSTVNSSYCNAIVNDLEKKDLILTKDIIQRKQNEQEKLDEEKKQLERQKIIEKNKEEAIPPKISRITLKDNTVIEGLIILTEKDNDKIVSVAIENKDGKIIKINYSQVEKIEVLK